MSEGGALSIAFASTYPDRAASLVLYGSFAKKVADGDYPWGVTPEQLEQFLERFDEAWATGGVGGTSSTRTSFPTPRVSSGWARYLRAAASPGMARDLLRMSGQIDVRDLLSAVELPGADHRPWLDDADAVLAEVEAFVTGVRRRPRHVKVRMGTEALSRREREVVRLAVQGESAPGMARTCS